MWNLRATFALKFVQIRRKMTKREKKLRLTLAIISGRENRELLISREWTLLGYDPYKIYGLSEDELKRKAEEIVLSAILENKEKQDEE